VGEVEFILMHTAPARHTNQTAELALPHMIWFFCLWQWPAIRRCSFVMLELFLR